MRTKTLTFAEGFRRGPGATRGQVAEMTLVAGDSTGGPDNVHQGSDQWMYGVAGHGLAIVNGRKKDLKAGTLLMIEKGDTHEIHNTGEDDLRTLDFYAPPAYRTTSQPTSNGTC